MLGCFVLIDKVVPVLSDRIGTFRAPLPLDHSPLVRSLSEVHGDHAPPPTPAPDPHHDTEGDHHANETNHHSDSGHGHHEAHASHPHEALFFLILAILIGTFVLHLGTFPAFKGMQQTVVLFVLGVLLSLLMSGMEFKEHAGAVGRSYEMWMVIDPHLLLFTLLPPLLAGDAMTIDMTVAFKVAKQCLYLAGPGVVINGFATALFLWVYLPYEWDFLLCLSTGAILCATDPVAVVALLKELGASPTLTVQIQGESLLNDGTAIVMFNVAYQMMKGQEYHVGDVVAELVKKAIYAWILGLMTGGFFWAWIKAAKNKLNHSSSTIQVLLTIACAYSSFLVSEGIFHISGVLCTVAASLFLASKMWAEVVCHETMHTIWHMLENLGNTIIFFLAGSLTGNIMLRIGWQDYLHLLMIYVVLVVLRFGLLIVSRPLLQYLVEDRRPVTLQEAIVMGWGGLRGAVGLALGIQVSRDRGGGILSEEDANRVLFYVGGVAFLTLVINAITCPALVKWLGITKTPETKRRLMLMIHQQLVDEFVEPEEKSDVRKALDVILQDLKHHISPGNHAVAKVPRDIAPRKSVLSKGMATVRQSIVSHKRSRVSGWEEVSSALFKEQTRFETYPEKIRDHVKAMMPKNPVLPHVDHMTDVMRQQKSSETDLDMLRCINEAFLALVRTAYWHQVENSELNSEEFEILVGSVCSALSSPVLDLNDLSILKRGIEAIDSEALLRSVRESERSRSGGLSRQSLASSQAPRDPPGCLERICESVGFRMLIFFAIIANSVFIVIEEYHPAKPGSSEDYSFLVVDVFFMLIFTVEFLLCIGYLRCQYFADSWNIFDLALVIFGWAAVAFQIMNWGRSTGHGQLAQTTRLFKILRSVRIMRLLTTFYKVIAALKGNSESAQVARHVRKFILYCAFVRAHCHAQTEIMRFLGRHEKPNTPELARCLMQSLTDCYKAMSACAFEEKHIDMWIMEERTMCQSSVEATSKMEDLIVEARDSGILSGSEAEAIIHTIHGYRSRYERRIDECRQGTAMELVDPGWEPDEEEPAAYTGAVVQEVGRRSNQGLVDLASEAARKSSTEPARKSMLSEPDDAYLRAGDVAPPLTYGMTLQMMSEEKGASDAKALEPAEEPPSESGRSSKVKRDKEKKVKKDKVKPIPEDSVLTGAAPGPLKGKGPDTE